MFGCECRLPAYCAEKSSGNGQAAKQSAVVQCGGSGHSRLAEFPSQTNRGKWPHSVRICCRFMLFAYLGAWLLLPCLFLRHICPRGDDARTAFVLLLFLFAFCRHRFRFRFKLHARSKPLPSRLCIPLSGSHAVASISA